MILPEPGRDGAGFLSDDRLPVPFASMWQDNAHRLSTWHPGGCASDRHLFDVIEVARSVEDADGQTTGVEFRARLTCVFCGHIVAWEGVRDAERSRSLRVDPLPISAGVFRAQQIADRGDGLTSYAVYGSEHADPIGVIASACGPRGRRYFQGRLLCWPQGCSVQGPTPLAALRKIAKTGRDWSA